MDGWIKAEVDFPRPFKPCHNGLWGRDPRSITPASAPSVAMPPVHFARVLPALVGALALAAPGGPTVPLGCAGDSARQDFAGSSFGQCSGKPSARPPQLEGKRTQGMNLI